MSESLIDHAGPTKRERGMGSSGMGQTMKEGKNKIAHAVMMSESPTSVTDSTDEPN